MKGLHALELAESQGVDALRAFLDRQAAPAKERVTPAQRAFLTDPDVVGAQTDGSRHRRSSTPSSRPRQGSSGRSYRRARRPG